MANEIALKLHCDPGDEVIAEVAKVVRGCTRTTDIVARYGGEEFVCVLVQTDVVGLSVLGERIRRSVEQLEVPDCPKVTISVGFALQNNSDTSGWDIVERADKALYHAKQKGRNRVESEDLGHDEIALIEEIERLRS